MVFGPGGGGGGAVELAIQAVPCSALLLGRWICCGRVIQLCRRSGCFLIRWLLLCCSLSVPYLINNGVLRTIQNCPQTEVSVSFNAHRPSRSLNEEALRTPLSDRFWSTAAPMILSYSTALPGSSWMAVEILRLPASRY